MIESTENAFSRTNYKMVRMCINNCRIL